MLGIDYLNRLAQLQSQSYPSSSWLDKKTSFDLMYEAAKDFAQKTKSLYTTQSITTVASQANYALAPDFLEVYSEDDDGNKILKYTDSSSNVYWLTQQGYRPQYYANNTTAIAIPSNFAIISKPKISGIASTVTATTTQSGGESTLTDATASFTSETIWPGDIVHNKTLGHIGVVLSILTTTTLNTAMFDVTTAPSSSYTGWSNTNAYLIQPGARYQVYIDPPPLTASETITVPYIQIPEPVYSDYGSYAFPVTDMEAILKYAVWLYKYRDSEPKFGDALYVQYDRAVREAAASYLRATVGKQPLQMKVSWKG